MPTMSSRKHVMQDWLTSHTICFPECAQKQEMYHLIRSSNFKPKYDVNEMARAAGCVVVRLPPYHCKLNPIEFAWSQVKRHNKDNNCLFTLSAVKDLTHEGFQKVDSSLWKKLVEHVRLEFEDKYWVDDGLQEEHIEEFIIRLGGDGDDESPSETSGNESSSDEAVSEVLTIIMYYLYIFKVIM